MLTLNQRTADSDELNCCKDLNIEFESRPQDYNNFYHRSIKRKPTEVNARNQEIVWKTLYGKVNDKVIQFKFNVGDLVRFREFNYMQFDKGYVKN
jgi:hypothetical protein